MRGTAASTPAGRSLRKHGCCCSAAEAVTSFTLPARRLLSLLLCSSLAPCTTTVFLSLHMHMPLLIASARKLFYLPSQLSTGVLMPPVRATDVFCLTFTAGCLLYSSRRAVPAWLHV
jgi:hypothetical protein